MGQVLVVEDDADIRLLIRVNLELAGLEAVESGRVTDALSHLHAATWAAVIVEPAMASDQGWQVLEAAAALPPARRPVVVVVTIDETSEASSFAMSMGATAHLTKPFMPDRLLKALADAFASDPPCRDRAEPGPPSPPV